MSWSIAPWLEGRGRFDASTEAVVLLLVEDDDVDAARVLSMIEAIPGGNWIIHRAMSLAEALTLATRQHPAVALVDLSLPDARGMAAVSAMLEAAPECAVIVQTSRIDDRSSMEALHLGAQDFLHKDSISVEILERSIRYAIMRQQAMLDLTRTSDRLARTDEELDDFAHVVAHDLRAPVRTARMLADRLVHQTRDGHPLNRMLGDRLDESLARVDAMILSMLDYSALRGSRPEPYPTSVRAMVRESAAALRFDISASDATVEVDIDDALGVLATDDLLTRVFQNVLANSLKYRREDVDPEITVSAKLVRRSVEIRIRDNGVGVPVADAERVFQILERLDARAADGLGFGLAICRRIVDGFGGDIRMEPNGNTGPGATVVIRLPAAPISSDTDSAASDHALSGS